VPKNHTEKNIKSAGKSIEKWCPKIYSKTLKVPKTELNNIERVEKSGAEKCY
jgi:hypothetical protein